MQPEAQDAPPLDWFYVRGLPNAVLPASGKLVWHLVDSLARPQGGKAAVSYGWVAKQCGLSRDAARNSLDRNVKLGILEVEKPGGPRKRTIYRVPSKAPAAQCTTGSPIECTTESPIDVGEAPPMVYDQIPQTCTTGSPNGVRLAPPSYTERQRDRAAAETDGAAAAGRRELVEGELRRLGVDAERAAALAEREPLTPDVVRQVWEGVSKQGRVANPPGLLIYRINEWLQGEPARAEAERRQRADAEQAMAASQSEALAAAAADAELDEIAAGIEEAEFQALAREVLKAQPKFRQRIWEREWDANPDAPRERGVWRREVARRVMQTPAGARTC